MKRLTLVRHAKSSWKSAALADFDRPLNQRGRHDAPVMAQRLAATGFMPDLVVSSPAERARETVRVFATELRYPPADIVWLPEIYLASPETLRDVVRGFEPDFEAAVLVGHNPGITNFVNRLTGERIDNVPTCGVVEIEWDFRSWSEAAQGNGTLRLFDFPKRAVD